MRFGRSPRDSICFPWRSGDGNLRTIATGRVVQRERCRITFLPRQGGLHRFLPDYSKVVHCTKEEMEACMNESRDAFMAATESPPGTRYAWQKGDKEIALDFDRIRKTHEVTFQIITMMAASNGGLRYPHQTLEYVPHPLAAKDAIKAVDEMAAFAADFKERVPENLQKYMIVSDMMDSRTQDIMLETMAELGFSNSADEWSAADAMTHRFSKLFGRLRRKPNL